jgi:cellulose synthase/poly-beta-1,6-N-acetylglucosamine synthase-like glycosyltransferase
MFAGSALLVLGAAGLATVLVCYPLALRVGAQRAPRPPARKPSPGPARTVSVVTAARNSSGLIAEKLANFSALDYPRDRLQLVVASDASTDDTHEIVRAATDDRVSLVVSTSREGKAAALNRAVAATTGELLLFSDADALLAPDAVTRLAAHFDDPEIGGVCGLRMLARSASGIDGAQARYVTIDSSIKTWESRRGRITSNDGKIHMIRRELYRPIPGDVTDDLFTALSVIGAGYKFIFDPHARAVIRPPSHSPRHELARRRRIVNRSLTGIRRVGSVTDPRRFGLFAVGLLVNKVGRRLIPFFLLLMIFGGALIAGPAATAWALLATLAVIALAALAARLFRDRGPWSRAWSVAGYLSAATAGTALGLIDFVAGRPVVAWEPRKGSGS